MFHAINDELREKINNTFQNEFINYHFNNFHRKLDFNEYTTNTKTRVSNVIFQGISTLQNRYFPDFKEIISKINIYIDIINKAIKEKDIIFAIDEFSNLQCIIGLSDKDNEKNLFLIRNNLYPISFNPNYDKDLFLLKHSLFKGITPIIKNKFFSHDYLNLIKNINSNCISHILLSINSNNFSSLISNHHTLIDNAFNGTSNSFFVKKQLAEMIDSFNYQIVKNYPLYKHFNEYLKTEIKDNPPIYSQNKLREICVSSFLNGLNEEKFSKILLSSNIYKINETIMSNLAFESNKIKENYQIFLQSMLDLNIPSSNKIDLKDFKIALFLFNNKIEHQNFYQSFISKYSQFKTSDFNDILDGIGLTKSESNKFKKQFAALSFNNDNKYVFNSIKETNIYGVSLDRKEFMLPIEDFSWTDIKYILHNAKNQDFFFSFNDDNLTLGLYSNYNFEFNRNDFVRTIIDTIIELKTTFINSHPKNQRLYLDFSRIPPDNIKNTFEKAIRTFMLNSATQSVNNNVPSHHRKKI